MILSRTYIGAFLISIAILIFWVLVLPAYDQATDLRAAVADRAAILDNRSAIVSNLASFNKQYAEHASDIQRFAYIVPAVKSSPELVSTIQAIAGQNGLALTSIALAGNQTLDNAPYNTQTIDLSLSGTYLNFRSFLGALESNIRMIDVISVDANPTTDNSLNLSFRIKANAYYLK